MNTYPTRDWMGVCVKCHRMAKTVILDYVGNTTTIVDYRDPPNFDTYHDYREVTECCHSEDFIPSIYAVRCALCNEWIDERFGYRKEDRYVCETCHEEITTWRGTIPVHVDMPPLPNDELGGGEGKGNMGEKV